MGNRELRYVEKLVEMVRAVTPVTDRYQFVVAVNKIRARSWRSVAASPISWRLSWLDEFGTRFEVGCLDNIEACLEAGRLVWAGDSILRADH